MKPRFTRKGFLWVMLAGVLLPTALLAWLSIALQREMFGVQKRVLEEFAHFSVDYVVSAVQERIRSRERMVHMHYRMVGLLQRFDPSVELANIEESYPDIAHAFLLTPDGTLYFADGEVSAVDGGAPGMRRTGGTATWDLSGMLQLRREVAGQVLRKALDPGTYDHLLGSEEAHFFRGQEGGEPYHLVAFGLLDNLNEPYGVAGFFLNLDNVRRKYLATLLEEAIEAAESRFSLDLGHDLAFVVRDHRDQKVYVHQHGDHDLDNTHPEVLARAELWDVFPGWTLRVVYPRGATRAAHILVVNTLLVLLMATVAVAGILLSLRFMLRQMELANLKSHFVSNITHELKTPLAAIRLYTETLQKKRVHDEEQAQKFLGIISKESVRLTRLINNILDFSRIEMGRKRYRFERQCAGDVVREVMDAYGYTLRDKGFTWNLEVEDDLPAIPVDRDALQQAVLNLVDNAVKYSDGERRIEVAVRRAGRGHPAGERIVGDAGTLRRCADCGVAITVRDHGMGIPSRERRKVFEPFYRVEKGLEHDVKGSGLGLAVVRSVAEAHGGMLHVDSERGAGTTITLTLPAEPLAEGGPHA